jgi:hypothetical protein
MGDIKILVGGKCEFCGHPQQTHEANTGCSYPIPITGDAESGEDGVCGCDRIGSY